MRERVVVQMLRIHMYMYSTRLKSFETHLDCTCWFYKLSAKPSPAAIPDCSSLALSFKGLTAKVHDI